MSDPHLALRALHRKQFRERDPRNRQWEYLGPQDSEWSTCGSQPPLWRPELFYRCRMSDCHEALRALYEEQKTANPLAFREWEFCRTEEHVWRRFQCEDPSWISDMKYRYNPRDLYDAPSELEDRCVYCGGNGSSDLPEAVVEKSIQRSINKLMEQIWEDHKIRVDSLRMQWVPASTVGEVRMKLIAVEMDSWTSVGN